VYKLTIIIVPTEKCNFKCAYCFEPQNQRSGLDIPLDIDAIKQSLIDVWAGPYGGSDLCLHGGEPTMIPRKTLEDLLKFLFEFKGCISIMTNGFTVDDYLISLFKRYNVYPGISIDGPPELNVLRGPDPSNAEVTANYNSVLMRNIKRMLDAGLFVAPLVIIHKKNASTQEHRDKMREWFIDLKQLGVREGRVNAMYSKPSTRDLELTNDEVEKFWKMIYDVNKEEGLRWAPITDMMGNLKGNKLTPCNFSRCDYFNTHTLSILPDGSIGNCDRTFQDGITLRSETGQSSGRYKALEQTQCKECRYWSVCGGGCPAEGENDDWRNKTRFCQAIYNTYAMLEREIRFISPDTKLKVDEDWTKPPEHQDTTHGDQTHGDLTHGDSTHGDLGHGDMTHGDVPHGDSTHGDLGHGDSGHGDKVHGDSSHYDAPDWRKTVA